MKERYTWATCSKIIQSEVKTLQTELSHLRGQNLQGFYLHGSLALGGFQPHRSDINARPVSAYLQGGLILSKDAGGTWGLAHLPGQYHPLFEQSLALYRGEPLGQMVGRVFLEAFAKVVLKKDAEHIPAQAPGDAAPAR